MKKNYLALPFVLISSLLSAQDTGWMSPSSSVAPNGWTTPGNAYKSDDLYTTVAHGSGCRCPWLYLSWDAGTTYTTSTHLLGPYGTTDSYKTTGTPTDNWGHSWVDTEFANSKFRLKIANPGISIEQGYADFNFSIPANATINGIEVQVEEHGDANYTLEYVDIIQAKVYYTVTTSVADRGSFNAKFSVYPNPASESLTVTTDEDFGNISSITLFDMQGKEVKKQAMNDKAVSASVNLSELRAGIYLMQVMNESGKISSKKITIE